MAYRNDDNAARARRLEVERELTDVRSRVDRFEYLKWRQKELEAELASLEKTEEILAKARLPMLARARVASACSADWAEMQGDDRVRFCGSCQKNVYNLSSLTAAEAEVLLVEKNGEVCARLYRRDDDTILTADCPVGARRKWLSRVAGALVATVGAAAAVLGYRLQPAPIPFVAADVSPKLAPPPDPAMAGGATDHGVIVPQVIPSMLADQQARQAAPHLTDRSGPPIGIGGNRGHTMGMVGIIHQRNR